MVTGGRDFPNRGFVFATLDALGIHRVIHGACAHPITDELVGADRWAHEWALSRGVTVTPMPADWERYGNAAGPIRNGLMVVRMLELRGELVVAFPGGRGTKNAVKQARAAGLEVLDLRDVPAAA